MNNAPKTYTLYANERDLVIAALKVYAEVKTATAERKMASLTRRHSDRVTVEKDAALNAAARAEHLISYLQE